MEFRDRLKKLREERKLSQSGLARQIYVSRSAVAKWENGLGLPGEDSLERLAEFFGVEKSVLAGDSELENALIVKKKTLPSEKFYYRHFKRIAGRGGSLFRLCAGVYFFSGL